MHEPLQRVGPSGSQVPHQELHNRHVCRTGAAHVWRGIAASSVIARIGTSALVCDNVGLVISHDQHEGDVHGALGSTRFH